MLIRSIGIQKYIDRNDFKRFAKIIAKTSIDIDEPVTLKIDYEKGIDIFFHFSNDKDGGNDQLLDHYPRTKTNIVISISTNEKSDMYIIDLDNLSKNFNINYPNHCLVYCHQMMNPDNYYRNKRDNVYFYHGFTSRTMPIRFKEHQKATSNFGNAYREYCESNNGNKTLMHIHTIIKDGLTKKEALDLEEKVIDSHSLFRDGKGNNMIPGGEKGLRIAKRLGFKDKESAEDILEEAIEDESKLNKLCSKVHNWEINDSQKSNIVCNNDSNFRKEEVNFIRVMSLLEDNIIIIRNDLFNKFKNLYPKNISKEYISINRVEKVINGKTYRFVT